MPDVIGPRLFNHDTPLPVQLRPADDAMRREVDVLAAAATTIALAAMGRDARIRTVVIRMHATLWNMTEIRHVSCEMEPPDLGRAIAEKVEDAARAMGWRVIGPSDGPAWDWVLVIVQRTDHSAHEIASALRVVQRSWMAAGAAGARGSR
jgi:hypothetical protein